MRTSLSLLALAAVLAACSGADNPPAESDASAAAPLTQGTIGPEVAEVHAYLGRYGYLPDAGVAQQHPEARPLFAEAPKHADLYDAQTAAAVAEVQRRAGLPVTGVVDATTLKLIRTPRCEHPDHLPAVSEAALQDAPEHAGDTAGHADHDGAATALHNADPAAGGDGGRARPLFSFPSGTPRWTKTALTWKVTGALSRTCNLTRSRADAKLAFDKWQAATSLTFTQVTEGDADIVISPFTTTQKLKAKTTPPPQGDIQINLNANVSCTDGADGFFHDLDRTLQHEVGHALGLGHSSVPYASMNPFPDLNDPFLTIPLFVEPDDALPLGMLYDSYVAKDAAVDVAAAQGTRAWVVTNQSRSGGFKVGTYSGPGASLALETADFGAVRIAMNLAVPVAVSDNGLIRRRVSSSSWTQLPGCATDVGGTQGNSPNSGSSNNALWVLGCTLTEGSGYPVFKWNEQNASWDNVSGGRMGLRIAADTTGKPYLIDATGTVYKRSTAAAAEGTWSSLGKPPGILPPFDIAVGDNDNVCVTGQVRVAGGTSAQQVSRTFILNKQGSVPGQGDEPGVPSRNTWLTFATVAGTACSIGENENVWLVAGGKVQAPRK